MKLTINSTTNLRGVLAILILLHHISRCIPTNNILYSFKEIGPAVVACFFFISSYGLQKKIETHNIDDLKKLRKRIYKLLLPFIIGAIVFQLSKIILSESWALPSNINDVLPYSWFIIAIIYVYILHYFSYTFINHFQPHCFNLMGWKIFLIGILSYILVTYTMQLGMEWWISCGAVISGYFFSIYDKYLTTRMALLGGTISLIVVIGLYLLNCNYLYLLIYALIPIIVACIQNIVFGCRCRILQYLGQISLTIYLFQGIVIYIAMNKHLPEYSTFYFILIALLITILMAGTYTLLMNKIIKRN